MLEEYIPSGGRCRSGPFGLGCGNRGLLVGARLYGFANNWGWFGVEECEGGAGGGDEVGREKEWRESGERG